MIVQQILGAALLVTVGFDPIDRAHGAKPSAVTNESAQDESGFWTRVKGRLFSRKSEVKPARSTTQSDSQVSTSQASADPERRGKTVHSNVIVRELLASRMSKIRDSKKRAAKKSEVAPLAQEDKRPILDRLRSRLAWHREKPLVESPEGRFAWFKKSTVQPGTQRAPQEPPELMPVPTLPVTDSATPATTELIRKNYPARESSLLTRVDSNPYGTATPAATVKEEGTLTPLVLRETTSKVCAVSPVIQNEFADEIAIPGGDVSSESLPQFAGPALVDPNAARSNLESIQIPARDEHAQASPLTTSSADPVTVADQPEAVAAPAQGEVVEPAKLEVGDQKAAAKIAQTRFVYHPTSVAAKGDSSARREARRSVSTSSSASNKSVLSGILSPALCERLSALPLECYPVVGLLLGAMLVLLLARGRGTSPQAAAPHVAHVATHLPGAVGWPVSMVLPSAAHTGGTDQTTQARGGLFGSLATTVGLAIIAVGAMAVLRSLTAQQPSLMRPGVMIAAAGQFVLLLGIVALAVHGRRSAIVRKVAGFGRSDAVAAQPVVAGTLPYLPIGAGYALPPSPSNHSGQIAQLKAQLACLSQQLDHLGDSETDRPTKAA